MNPWPIGTAPGVADARRMLARTARRDHESRPFFDRCRVCGNLVHQPGSSCPVAIYEREVTLARAAGRMPGPGAPPAMTLSIGPFFVLALVAYLFGIFTGWMMSQP